MVKKNGVLLRRYLSKCNVIRWRFLNMILFHMIPIGFKNNIYIRRLIFFKTQSKNARTMINHVLGTQIAAQCSLLSPKQSTDYHHHNRHRPIHFTAKFFIPQHCAFQISLANRKHITQQGHEGVTRPPCIVSHIRVAVQSTRSRFRSLISCISNERPESTLAFSNEQRKRN